METSESIVLGVVSGVLTSSVIFIVVQLFNKLLIPWYRSTIYKGLDISGEWEERVQHNGATDHTRINFIQRGQQLIGTMTVIKHLLNSQEIITKTLFLTGSFQDGTLLFLCCSTDNKVVGYSTCLLRVTRGGRSLEGIECWLDVGTNEVHSRGADYRRKT